MTTSALWSGLTYPANTFTFSADRLTATYAASGGASRQCVFVPVALTSGRYRFSVQYGGSAVNTMLGVVNTSDSLNSTSGNPPNGFVLVMNGYLYTVTAGVATQQAILTAPSAGQWIDFEFDTGAGTGSSGTAQAWARVNGGAWNGSSTANPDTNTGGIATPLITSFTPFAQIFDNAGTFVLNSGATAYAFTMDSTFSDLPQTLNTSLPVVAKIGAPLDIPWSTANLASGLNYSVNGGAFTACSGVVTGATGTATAGTLSTPEFAALVFQDAANPIDQTTTQYTAALTGPTSSTATLAASIGNSAWIAPDGNPSVELTAAPKQVIFLSGIYGDAGGATSTGAVRVYNSDGVEVSYAALSNSTSTTTLDATGFLYGAAPTSGGVVTVTGPLVAFTATLDASLGTTPDSPAGTATITANGTVTQFGAAASPDTWQGTQTLPFYTLALEPGALAGNIGLAVGIWAEPSVPPSTPLPADPRRQRLYAPHITKLFPGRGAARPAWQPGVTPPSSTALPFDRHAALRFAQAPLFRGRGARAAAVVPPPAPPVYGHPAGLQRRLAAWVTQFAAQPFKGRAAPRYGRVAYGGGAGLPARASQIVTETLAASRAGARASQSILEALTRDPAGMRASQIITETLYQQTNPTYVRASQIVLEVLAPYTELPVIPVYPQLIGLTFDYTKRPKNSVGRGTGSSGREIAVGYWANPQWEWDLTYDILADNGQGVGTTASDIKTMIGFFLWAAGTLSPFYFQDPDDNQVTGQALAVGDGSTKQFTFVRTYGLDSILGNFTGTEPIGGLNLEASSPVIYLDSVAQEGGFTIDNSTPYGNTVTFSTAPGVGVAVTGDFSFYYFCRLKDDTLDYSKFMNGLWELKKITIFSLKN
jgi:uncharacterized protein (TIGR02217 family)